MPVNSFDTYPMNWKPTRDALGTGPLYLALAAALERDVRSGALPPGTRLPPQRELADFLDIDFTTVTRAYGVCRDKGLVYGVTGRGTFVASGLDGMGDDADRLVDLGVVQAFPEIGATVLVEAAQTVLARETARRLFTYGDRDGLRRHRVAGRQWLARCGVAASDDRIAVFPGVQGALSTALLTVFGVGDALAVDPFTYGNLLAFARLAGVRLVPVAGDAHGMRPEALDAAAQHGVTGVFLMPNCANPTTLTLPEGRKDELAAVAARRGLLVLEDDASLCPPRPGRRTLFARRPDATVYLAGSTRLLAPGLRATYVCAPAAVRDRLFAGLHHATIKASALDAEILGELVLSGMAESVLAAKAKAAEKANQIFDAVFFPNADASGDKRRLFRTCPLPGTTGRGPEIERVCRTAGLRVFHSDRFAVVRGAPNAFLRVSLCSAGGARPLRHALEALRGLLPTLTPAPKKRKAARKPAPPSV